MKDLKATRGARLLERMIAEGEHERQDFKFAISDARKIARSLSAFANHSGGRLLIGVKDNGVVAGVRNEEDIYVVEQAAERYCRPQQRVTFKAYRSGELTVIVAEIEAAEVLPVRVVEADGSLKAYYRVADENIAAPPLMVRAWELAAKADAPALDAGHFALAALFGDTPGSLDEREVALRLHISTDEASARIARLIAAGVLALAHDGTQFRIVQA
ncbi:MAG: ATP-binding protein [Muribaculaceae bacterium]|nr:ATP-binding protein [Muribaculaceae bacterium]